MREIKFRAWEPNAKKMSYRTLYQISMQGFGLPIESSETVIMQYTGLKDKNGNEIYEGDCFQIKKVSKKGSETGIAIIVWDNSCSKYRLDDTLEDGEYNLHYFAKNQEVIGNIHENPELIKN